MKMITETMIEEALRYMGIRDASKDESIKEKIVATFNEIEQSIHPKYVKGVFDLEKEENQTVIKGTTYKIESQDLKKLFVNCNQCILLAATLGIDADQAIKRKQSISMLEALIMDTCCSVWIEKIVDEVESIIWQELKEGQYLTMRFSPGYGDVPLTSSKELLQILNAHKRIGLSLTQTYMLLPSKSVTAFIGISNQRENRQKNCGKCNLVRTCIYRKRGERCGL